MYKFLKNQKTRYIIIKVLLALFSAILTVDNTDVVSSNPEINLDYYFQNKQSKIENINDLDIVNKHECISNAKF